MSQVASNIAAILASLLALLIGWRSAGKNAATASYHKQKSREASAIINKLTEPLSPRSAFRARLHIAISKRLRDQLVALPNPRDPRPNARRTD